MVVDRIVPGRKEGEIVIGSRSRVLIVRVEHLGDVVSTFSLIKQIRKKGYGGEISLMISEQSYKVLKEIVPADNCIVVSTPIMHDRTGASLARKISSTIRSYIEAAITISSQKYDLVIFPSPNLFGYQVLGLVSKASIAVSSAGLHGIHTVCISDNPQFSVYDINMEIVDRLRIDQPGSGGKEEEQRYLTGKGARNMSRHALVVAKSGNPRKDLRKDDLITLLADLLPKHGVDKLFLIGDYDDDQKKVILGLDDEIALICTGKLSNLNTLMNLIEESTFILTTDSFMSHYSSYCSSHVPIYIVFYEEIPSIRWKPEGKNIIKLLRFKMN